MVSCAASDMRGSTDMDSANMGRPAHMRCGGHVHGAHMSAGGRRMSNRRVIEVEVVHADMRERMISEMVEVEMVHADVRERMMSEMAEMMIPVKPAAISECRS